MPLVLLLYHTQEHVKISVTKFGEISPLWQNSASLWAIFKPTLANCYAIGQVSVVINGPILKNNLTIWSHWSVKCSRPI